MTPTKIRFFQANKNPIEALNPAFGIISSKPEIVPEGQM